MGNTQPDFAREEEGWEVVSVVSLMAREPKLKAHSARMCLEDSECTQASIRSVERVVYGRPKVVYGWLVVHQTGRLRVVCGWPNRCTYVADFRSATALQFLAWLLSCPLLCNNRSTTTRTLASNCLPTPRCNRGLLSSTSLSWRRGRPLWSGRRRRCS